VNKKSSIDRTSWRQEVDFNHLKYYSSYGDKIQKIYNDFQLCALYSNAYNKYFNTIQIEGIPVRLAD